jgi:hypothetical protein
MLLVLLIGFDTRLVNFEGRSGTGLVKLVGVLFDLFLRLVDLMDLALI